MWCVWEVSEIKMILLGISEGRDCLEDLAGADGRNIQRWSIEKQDEIGGACGAHGREGKYRWF